MPPLGAARGLRPLVKEVASPGNSRARARSAYPARRRSIPDRATWRAMFARGAAILIGRLLRNDVAIVGAGQLLQQVVTMATGIILARMLQASGYGVVNLLRSLFTALMTV